MLKPLNRQTAQIQTVFPERIVQFGGGNFLRAFADWIIQELNEQTDFASSVVIVKPAEQGKYESLEAQDGLFHVHLQGIQSSQLVSRSKLITCVNRTVYPYQDYGSYLELAAQPQIRFIISNVTEAGIAYVENDQQGDSPPSSFPAKLTAFLYHRFQIFAGDSTRGCIILPTELVESNGDCIREMVLRYAEQWRLVAGFSQWIRQHNIFCNTLVDRIVPGYPAAQSEQILESLGYDDRLLVMGEPYHSWIIEAPDSLKQEFPVHKTNLNVKIVDDADPFRETKVRILNGVHTSMVALGYLTGLEEVREAVEHTALGRFLHDLVYQEIIPSMDLPTAELRQFAGDVFDRFRNPYIHHRLLSIAQNSTSKIKSRVIPSIESYAHKFNKPPERLTFAFAAFIQFYKGEWNGAPIPLKDDPTIITWFAQQWRTCDSIPALVKAILTNDTLWGQDLSRIENFPERLIDLLEQIEREGLLPILERINS